MDILARVRGTQDVDRLGRAIGDTGDEMSGAARDADRLDRAIEDLEREIADLNVELLRTGDIDVFEKIRNDRSALAMMRRMRNEIGDVRKQSRGLFGALGESLAALPAQVRGGLIIGLGGVGALAAPLIGAAISAGVIGGVGAGGIVGGVLAASRSPQVGAAADHLAERMSQPMRRIGVFFADPVVEALDAIGDAGTDVLGDLTPELRDLAPVVADLAEGIGGLAREATPGIKAVLREARPLLQALAEELPETGEALGAMLDAIADGGEDSIVALRTINELLKLTIGQVTLFTRLMTNAFGVFDDVANSKVLGWMTGLGGIIVRNAQKTDDARQSNEDWATSLTGVVLEALDAAGAGTSGFAVRLDLANSSMAEAINKAGSLRNVLDELAGGALAARAAEREFEAAVDAANTALEEHGATLDLDTEAGRANQDALDAIAAAALNAASTTYEDTEATKGRIEAEKAAIARLKEGRQALIQTAIQMGLNKKEAKELANRILGIPQRWRTDVSTNANKAKADVESFIRRLRDIPKGRTVTITTRHVNQFITSRFGVNAPQLRAGGGEVVGPAGVDRVPLMATAGEFVVQRHRSQRFEPLLRAINSGSRLAIQSAAADMLGRLGRVQTSEPSRDLHRIVPMSVARPPSVTAHMSTRRIELVIRGDGSPRAAFVVDELRRALRSVPGLRRELADAVRMHL
jgi:hypothetical protein